MEDQLFCSSEISNWVNPDCKGKAGRVKERERLQTVAWALVWQACTVNQKVTGSSLVCYQKCLHQQQEHMGLTTPHRAVLHFYFHIYIFFLLSVLLKVGSHLHNAWKCLLSTQMRRINFRGGGGICLFVYFYLYDGKDWCEHVRRIYRRINAVIAVPMSFAYPN